MNSNDFIDWFGSITGNENMQSWSDVDELNSLWDAYDSYVQELKADGYKIFRNEHGKHKIVGGK